MKAGPDKLSLIVFSGDFEKVHYALATAAAALAVGTPATLFFTMKACRALGAGGGWKRLACQTEGGAEARDKDLEAKGVATFEVLLTSCADLDARFMVCEMGLRAEGLEDMALRDDIGITEGGLVTFLGDASATGTVIFI